MPAELRALLALAFFGPAACVSNPGPPGFLLDSREAQRQSVGGWIEVTTRHPDGNLVVTGELLSASPDTVWVMTDSGALPLSTGDLVDGRLVGYDPEAGQVAAATLLGVVSTLSNGAFLIFTAPMWAIGGSLAASSQRKVSVQEAPPAQWQDLSRFARFPQGIPPTLDVTSLRPLRR